MSATSGVLGLSSKTSAIGPTLNSCVAWPVLLIRNVIVSPCWTLTTFGSNRSRSVTAILMMRGFAFVPATKPGSPGSGGPGGRGVGLAERAGDGDGAALGEAAGDGDAAAAEAEAEGAAEGAAEPGTPATWAPGGGNDQLGALALVHAASATTSAAAPMRRRCGRTRPHIVAFPAGVMVAWTGLIISPATRIMALVPPDATACRTRNSSAGMNAPAIAPAARAGPVMTTRNDTLGRRSHTPSTVRDRGPGDESNPPLEPALVSQNLPPTPGQAPVRRPDRGANPDSAAAWRPAGRGRTIRAGSEPMRPGRWFARGAPAPPARCGAVQDP